MTIKPVPLTNVTIEDAFWSPRQRLMTDVTIPHMENILMDRVEGAKLLREVRTDGSGLEAITRYRVLKQADGSAALVEMTIDTGRTHQIRVHMADAGHPLIGDPLYGSAETPGRALLHASRLAFEQPFTGERTVIDVPFPEDFKDIAVFLNLF